MYLQQPTYTQRELEKFAAHLQRLKEMSDFFQQQLAKTGTADMEPILKLMNALVDLYS